MSRSHRVTAGAALALSILIASGQSVLAQDASPSASPTVEVLPAKEPPASATMDKLPVDLPSVIIRGEDETTAPLKGGSKLMPVDPRAPLSRLPAAPNAKAPGTLEQAIQPVESTLSPQAEVMPTPRDTWTELQLGIGSLYELGVFHGREIAGAVTESQVFVDSAMPWTRARLGIDATWNQATAGLGLRHYLEAVPGGEQLMVQSLDLGGSWQRDDLLTEGTIEAGRVLAPTNYNNGIPQDEDTWTRALEAGALWKPQLHPDHVMEVSATLGHRETDRRSDPTVYLRAFDHWVISPRWSVEAGLGGGLYVGMPVFDPSARVSYRPDDPTEISFGLSSASDLPSFEDLYLTRRLTEGNGALLPQRSLIQASLAGSHRLNDLWYATAELSYERIERFIFWEDLDQDGLWRPANAALENAQNVMGAELSATYQIGAIGSQRFHYRVRGAQPLGLVYQEAGAVHQRTLIPDRLSLEAGAAIAMDQLSAAQINAPAAGWMISAQAAVNYRFNDRLGFYAKLQDLPLAMRKPSENYYAPFGLALVGATLEF